MTPRATPDQLRATFRAQPTVLLAVLRAELAALPPAKATTFTAALQMPGPAPRPGKETPWQAPPSTN